MLISGGIISFQKLFKKIIRTPFIARWIGKIKPNTTNNSSVISSIDFFSTLLKMAGVSSKNNATDSEDISASLLGKPFERKQLLYWEYGRNDSYLKPCNVRFVSPNLAIREKDWKLLMNNDSTRVELYNLKNDPAENNNVSGANPSSVKHLSGLLLQWRKSLPD